MPNVRSAERWPRPATLLAIAVLSLLVAGGLFASRLSPFSERELLGDARLLAPLASRWAVPLASGGRQVADRVDFKANGDLTLHHRGSREELLASELAPGTEIERIRFWLGTDAVGRDVFSRLLHGARLSLSIAFLAVLLIIVVGVIVGAAAALGGRILDSLLMRLVDGLFAFPTLFLVIILVAVFDQGIGPLIGVLGLTGWMGTSRIVRGELLRLKNQDFVLAARGLGLSPVRIFLRHLLPHVLTPLIIQATLAVASIVAAEAALSFFGLGVQPPAASWGSLIQDGRLWLLDAWWISTFPAVSLTATIIALNVLGDRLRDRLDPRH